MPFYLAWIYSNFSRWNFKFFSNSELSYGTNQDFMPFFHAQFFVARYPQKLHSVTYLHYILPQKGCFQKDSLLLQMFQKTHNCAVDVHNDALYVAAVAMCIQWPLPLFSSHRNKSVSCSWSWLAKSKNHSALATILANNVGEST